MVNCLAMFTGRRAVGLGALRERELALLFSATVLTSLGSIVGTLALAFAVLDVAGPTSLGVMIAAREVASAAVLIFGGVLSDRARRNLVLVGASVLQGVAQGAIAIAVLAEAATVPLFVATGILWGLGGGLVVPAETGLVPQTVSPARLQQANALQGLSRSGVRVLGPALGGVLVVALNPGWALAVDSASFFACAVLLGRMRIAPRVGAQREGFFDELRAGWREFTARTWLWSTVLIFGLGNVFFMFLQVLGPAIADDRLGGAGAWAAILTASGVGAIAGGVSAMRLRPGKPLVACILWPLLILPQFAALASGAPTWLIAVAAFGGASALPTTWRSGSPSSSEAAQLVVGPRLEGEPPPESVALG
jgi:MFS family permease